MTILTERLLFFSSLGFRLLRLCFVLILLSFSLTATAQPADAALELTPGSRDALMLRKQHMGYHLSSRELPWAALASISAERWAPPRNDTVGGYAPDASQWLRLPLRNGGEREGLFQLEIRWPMLQQVEMAVLREDGLGPIRPDGAETRRGRQVIHKSITFPIALQAGETATVYLRVDDRALLYMPMFVWDDAAYRYHSDLRLVMLSLVVGMLLLMVLYNGSLFLFTRDRMYLVYSNSVFSTMLFVLTITGLGQIVWGRSEWISENAYALFSSYAYLSVTYFFRVFVGLHRYRGWLLWLNNGVIGLWLTVFATSLAGLQELALTITAPGGIFATCAGFASALVLALRGSRSAQLFSIAWASVCIASTYSILTIFGLVPYLPGLDIWLALSFVVEVVVLSVALADRINRERQGREAAQALALERQKEVARIQEQANTELESQVDARTSELREALAALARANGELARLSITDPLTGLANRRQFDRMAEAEVARAARTAKPVSMMVVDIDHFKHINDVHGHLVGDECLKLIAEAIRQVVSRETDTVARYGGEEFAVILPATTEADALRVAERVRVAIAAVGFDHEGSRIATTASIGVASTRLDRPCPVQAVIGAADKALYRAKQSGRDQVQLGALADLKYLESQRS